MPTDYYDDEGDNPGSDTMTAKPSEKDEMQPQSALVPKAFFSGKDNLEVGDVERVKVLRLMDDEVEIECIKEGYDHEEKKEAPVSEEDEMMA